jgi:hypothetical protein
MGKFYYSFCYDNIEIISLNSLYVLNHLMPKIILSGPQSLCPPIPCDCDLIRDLEYFQSS